MKKISTDMEITIFKTQTRIRKLQALVEDEYKDLVETIGLNAADRIEVWLFDYVHNYEGELTFTEFLQEGGFK